jgi:hypothetical protein
MSAHFAERLGRRNPFDFVVHERATTSRSLAFVGHADLSICRDTSQEKTAVQGRQRRDHKRPVQE